MDSITALGASKQLTNSKVKEDEQKKNGTIQFQSETQCPEPTQLRISTMTATCKTNMVVDLTIIRDHIPLVEYGGSSEGVLKVVYGDTIKGMCCKDIESGKAKTSKVFYNQSTIVLRIYSSIGLLKEVNAKLFNNGSIQMTGLKSEEDGRHAVEILVKYLQEIPPIECKTDKGEIEINHAVTYYNNQTGAVEQTFRSYNFSIALINSDYCANFKIIREKLHQILVDRYKIFSSYEPCIYPGINSKYYWNKQYLEFPKKGICYCNKPCSGKGNGDGDGNCKKITIAIFQSGAIIITGARTLQQLQDAYTFINDVFRTHYQDLKRAPVPSHLLAS